jgi:hypothetical protein
MVVTQDLQNKVQAAVEVPEALVVMDQPVLLSIPVVQEA